MNIFHGSIGMPVNSCQASLLLIFLICGCGSPVSTNTSAKDDSPSVHRLLPDAVASQDTTVSDGLYVLYLDSSQFAKMVEKSKGNSTQVAFQYCFTTSAPDKLTMCGWPSKRNGRFYDRTDTTILRISDVVNTRITGGMYFSTQKLTHAIIDSIEKRLTTSTDIVAFYPLIRNDRPEKKGELLYEIKVHRSFSELKKRDVEVLLTGLYTNPAPPGVFNNVDSDLP